MPPAEFLRQQAYRCLRLARECFDLTTAGRLREMAADLRAKADQLEDHSLVDSYDDRNGWPRSSTEKAVEPE